MDPGDQLWEDVPMYPFSRTLPPARQIVVAQATTLNVDVLGAIVIGDTSGGSFAIGLPSADSVGPGAQFFVVAPQGDVNPLDVNFGGSTFNLGQVGPISLTTANATLTLTSDGSTYTAYINSSGGALQDLWATINSDSGSTTANTATDTLTIAGGVNVSTAVVGDTLTINSTVTGVAPLNFGAQPSGAGLNLRVHGESNTPAFASYSSSTEFVLPFPFTIRFFAINTDAGDATTTFEVHINGVLAAGGAIAMTGAITTGALSISGSANDRVALRFTGGTNPSFTTAQLWVS